MPPGILEKLRCCMLADWSRAEAFDWWMEGTSELSARGEVVRQCANQLLEQQTKGLTEQRRCAVITCWLASPEGLLTVSRLLPFVSNARHALRERSLQSNESTFRRTVKSSRPMPWLKYESESLRLASRRLRLSVPSRHLHPSSSRPRSVGLTMR